MRLIATLLCALALTGCAHEYAAYAEAHKAQAAAQTARYQALADIAKQGDTTAKVAAVMSLQMGGSQQNAQINAPKSWADYAMQWTGCCCQPLVKSTRSTSRPALVCASPTTPLLWASAPTTLLSALPRRFKRQQPMSPRLVETV